MKPLIILIAFFVISLVTIKFVRGMYDFSLSGRIALSMMLLFTAAGHFAFTQGMSMMIPTFMPYKSQLVYLTGVIEIAAAICLQIPSLRINTAWWLIVFFILVLPANIYAAFKHIDYQKGTYEGSGLSYLWFRVPLQILFIVWTYLSSVPLANYRF
jgi:uncharacterized membrane protein